MCVKIYVKSDSDPLKHYRNHGKEIFQFTQGRSFGSIWSSVQLMLIFFFTGGGEFFSSVLVPIDCLSMIMTTTMTC